MTNVFYHGGHIGDVVYSLYTIKTAGGGILKLGPGQQSMWGRKQIDALIPLCKAQSYIDDCFYSEDKSDVTHDFTTIGGLYNPEEFFEWDGRVWPGNAHLKKRYFNSYWRKKVDIAQQLYIFSSDDSWLESYDCSPHEYDIVFHAPLRKQNDCRPQSSWYEILQRLSNKYSIVVIGGDDINEWDDTDYYTKLVPSNFLEVQDMIATADLFLGNSSCNHVIAEGLDQIRMIDMAPQTEGSEPHNQRGWDITKWSDRRVVDAVQLVLGGN